MSERNRYSNYTDPGAQPDFIPKRKRSSWRRYRAQRPGDFEFCVMWGLEQMHRHVQNELAKELFGVKGNGP